MVGRKRCSWQFGQEYELGEEDEEDWQEALDKDLHSALKKARALARALKKVRARVERARGMARTTSLWRMSLRRSP